MSMNSDPTRRRFARATFASLPVAATIMGCTNGSPDSAEPSSTTTPPQQVVESQTVFCNPRPQDKPPVAGPGTSAYEFVLGNPTAEGRVISRLFATLSPPGPDAPPGANAGIMYEWDFADDLPSPNPADATTTAKLQVDGTIYVMGITAVITADHRPQLETFCAPEGSPDIPPPITTFTTTPPIATI